VQEALDRSARASAALLAGKAQEARHELQAVIGTVPTFGHAWSEMGRARWKLGDRPGAEEAFRRALAAYRPDQASLRVSTEALLAELLGSRATTAPR
jgi:predicted Zn-dependent protease